MQFPIILHLRVEEQVNYLVLPAFSLATEWAVAARICSKNASAASWKLLAQQGKEVGLEKDRLLGCCSLCTFTRFVRSKKLDSALAWLWVLTVCPASFLRLAGLKGSWHERLDLQCDFTLYVVPGK